MGQIKANSIVKFDKIDLIQFNSYDLLKSLTVPWKLDRVEFNLIVFHGIYREMQVSSTLQVTCFFLA